MKHIWFLEIDDEFHDEPEPVHTGWLLAKLLVGTSVLAGLTSVAMWVAGV